MQRMQRKEHCYRNQIFEDRDKPYNTIGNVEDAQNISIRTKYFNVKIGSSAK